MARVNRRYTQTAIDVVFIVTYYTVQNNNHSKITKPRVSSQL